MDRPVEKEELYELHHVPGSDAFWKSIRAVLVEPGPREPTPLPQSGLPPINVSDNRHPNLVAKPHTPGHHGDSPTPPKGMPPIANDQTKHLGWTTRPPNHNPTNQLFFKKKDIENQQARVIEKYKHTNPIPIHRGMVEAVEEPSAWKLDRKKRVDNAINRVNKSYVIDPRTYKEPDINERVDNEFMPTPPTCPKPTKPRKHNLVIVDPEKMLRERNLMRGDFAPGRPTGHVPESCHSRLAAQIAAPIKGHRTTSTHDAYESECGPTPSSSVHSSSAVPSKRSDQRYAYGQSAADNYRAHPEQVDSYNRAQAGHQSTSSHNVTAAPSKRSGVPLYNQRYVYKNADYYDTSPQHAYDNHYAEQASGFIYENGPLPPQDAFERHYDVHKTSSSPIDVSASPVRSGVTLYDQRVPAEYLRACPRNEESQPSHLRTTVPDQAKEWRQDRNNRVHMAKERVQQEYIDLPRFDYYYEPESVLSQGEIDLDAKRQQMHARKCIEKRRKEALLKKAAELQAANQAGTNGPMPPGSNHVYKPTPPTTRYPGDGMTGKETSYSASTEKQQLIPRCIKPTHGPTIRVEPQLTWNASAAKRGLGFKSKLRREQEEAARQNKTTDTHDAPSGAAPSTPQLSEDARRRWRNKTIGNQP